MNITLSNHAQAKKAYTLVKSLQNSFVGKLNSISSNFGSDKNFKEVSWLRNDGLNGGGSRFQSCDLDFFNTASVNVSQVHYENDESKTLNSASAISTIIHPNNPLLPSFHMHISYTLMKDGKFYWRIMADLNPSNERVEDTEDFFKSLKELAQDNYEEGIKQGDKYFYIPALNRERGVSHFYLENYYTENQNNDFEYALNFGEGIINTYVSLIAKRTVLAKKEEIQIQKDYHTLYLYQVLLLDKGTISGLLVHNQNELGIMASLPKIINKNLLESWIKIQVSPQNELLKSICENIDSDGLVDNETKTKIAQSIREHYKNNKSALNLLASGFSKTTTVSNHK